MLNKDLDWKEATVNSTKKEKYAALQKLVEKLDEDIQNSDKMFFE